MKDASILFIFMLPSIILSLAAGYMAMKGIQGWGWFLFIVLLLAGSADFSTSDCDKSKANMEQSDET